MTNSGDYNTFEDMTLQGLDVGIEIGDVFSPDLTGTVIQRIDSIAVPVVFRLFGGNVAEVHFRDIGPSAFSRAAWQIFGYSNRRLRSRQNITDQPHAPTPSWCPTLWAPCTVQDLDGNEIAWEDVPIWAQEFAPGLVGKGDNWQNASGPAGLAEAGGGGPTLTIENVVASSSFCDAWLIDSNYPAVRLTGLRQEGCAALYRNTGIYAPYTDRTRFSDVLAVIRIDYLNSGLRFPKIPAMIVRTGLQHVLLGRARRQRDHLQQGRAALHYGRDLPRPGRGIAISDRPEHRRKLLELESD